MADTSDETLMRRYQDGESSAFDTLYARYQGPLYRYFLRHCKDTSLADELYQDVWLRLIKARKQWKTDQPFSPWLFRIAHNRLVDHWRRHKADSDVLEEEQLQSDGLWPDAWVAIRDCVERLFKLLGGLAEDQRNAFLLKEEAGLSLAQIAEVTGVGRETVKSRLRYAMKRLRGGLEDCDD